MRLLRASGASSILFPTRHILEGNGPCSQFSFPYPGLSPLLIALENMAEGVCHFACQDRETVREVCCSTSAVMAIKREGARLVAASSGGKSGSCRASGDPGRRLRGA